MLHTMFTGTPTIYPDSLSGLLAWYDAGVGVTLATGVSNWADQSGNGNDLTQATGSKQPAYSASGGPNSRPVITFDGVDDWLLANSPWINNTNLDIHFFSVVKWVGGTSSISTTDSSASRRLHLHRSAVNTIYVDFHDGTGSTLPQSTDLNESAFQVIQFKSVPSAGYLKLQIDNFTELSYSRSIGSSALTQSGLGGRRDTIQPCSHAISELFCFNRELSSSETTFMRNYINSKYGI